MFRATATAGGNPKNRPFGPRSAAFTAVVFWGLSFVATKAALAEISPETLIFTRFAFGAALLIALLKLRGQRPLPPFDALWPLACMGFFGVFVHQMLQATALTMTSAVQTGWLIGVIPIWSALLSALMLKEKFTGLKLLGLLGGFAGVVLVISHGQLSAMTLKLPSTRGDFLVLLSTINWAFYSVIGHSTIKRLGPTRATAGSMLLGWLMLAPLFIWKQGWREWPHLSSSGWGALLFLGICCSGLGYLFWYGALEHIEVSRVASFLYIEPLVTLVAAVLLLRERVTATTILGGLLVLASVFLIQRLPKPKTG
jgi:drug/metabolite transporter (DMT)-like permease